MIARISSEGQYRLTSACLDKLNEIDNKLVDVVAENNEVEFKRLLAELLDLVRKEGKPLPNEELVGSDVILPAPDTTLDEARHMFEGEGLFQG